MTSHIQSISRFFKHVDPEVNKYIKFMIILGICTGLLEYSFVYVLQLFIFSMGLVEREAVTIPSFLPTDTLFVIGLLILFGSLRTLFAGSKIYLTNLSAQMFNIKNRKEIIKLTLQHPHGISSGKAISVFSDEVQRGGMAVLRMAHLIITCVTALILFLFGLYLAPKEMTLGLLLLAVTFFVLKFSTKNKKISGKDISSEWDNTNKSFLEGIKNNFYLKVYGLVDNEINKATSALDKYLEHFKKFIRMSALRQSLPSLLGISLLTLVTYIGLNQFSTPPATILAFLYVFMRLAQTLGDASGVYMEYTVYSSSLETIKSWSEATSKRIKKSTAQAHQLTPKTQKPETQITHLDLKNVAFKYDSENILQNVSFSLKSGDLLKITGESGSGKSTLIGLVLGLLEPTSGSVKINGVDVYRSRDQFIADTTYIGPQPYFVEGSIRDNLLYGNAMALKITDREINRALEAVSMQDCISSLPNQLNSRLDELGSTLSTGQRQRISIARGLLRKTNFIVMDEALSNLDADTESLIIESLKEILRTKISVVVTHKKAFDQLATYSLDMNKKKTSASKVP